MQCSGTPFRTGSVVVVRSSKASFSGQDSDSSEESESDSGDGDEVDSDENVD